MPVLEPVIAWTLVQSRRPRPRTCPPCRSPQPFSGPASRRRAGFALHCGPMKRETIAIHGAFDSDPATHAVAVPIYQTAAYCFDSAEHGAALFNLEIEGYRYTRIANPTCAILEQRVTELEGG